MLVVAMVAPGHAAGRNATGTRAGELLENVIKHYQDGELEHAWDAYRKFFDDPTNRNVGVNAFGRCFYQQQCPALGLLAFVLGKSEAEAGNFQSFCPDWEHLGIGDLNADQLGESERTMRGFRQGALGGSCTDWVTRMAAWFHPRPPGHRLERQVVSLAEPSSWDSRPYSEVEILATRVNALLDTGATATLLNRRWADQFPDNVEMMQEVRMRFSRHEDTVALGAVDHMRLGYGCPAGRIGRIARLGLMVAPRARESDAVFLGSFGMSWSSGLSRVTKSAMTEYLHSLQGIHSQFQMS